MHRQQLCSEPKPSQQERTQQQSRSVQFQQTTQQFSCQNIQVHQKPQERPQVTQCSRQTPQVLQQPEKPQERHIPIQQVTQYPCQVPQQPDEEPVVPKGGRCQHAHKPQITDNKMEASFKTSSVFRAGTDGVFEFYLGKFESFGQLQKACIGPFAIKAEGSYLETGTHHKQTYGVHKFLNSPLLTGGADALIIRKSTSSFYDQISDGWKPELISITYKRNGQSYNKTFAFPKCEKDGWLEKNGFYVVTSRVFFYIPDSENMKIEDIHSYVIPSTLMTQF
ncbi:hypothetical protein L596_025261 [Steinernema carpocapsae]|uniref:Uncharacterized protein n=1 Tax=Steinernema carpocapsae TaxID=34508 RepID=A0A4U5M7A1_STECR|nr:hypothetical protein L596_025261 [Steinernema carpocapsae]